MYARTYKYKSKYYLAWFEDDGKLLDAMRLQYSGKGLLTFSDYSLLSALQFKKLESKLEEIPYELCLVILPPDGIHTVLNLYWGAYNENELSSSRTRKRIVPLSCLMDFVSDFLDSHEDYHVTIDYLYEICGGATHHMAYPEWITGSPYEKLAKTMKIYLSEVLSP